MHLLLIHNNYGAYSGEETVVDRQISLFEQLGYRISVYRKTTEGSRGTAWGNLKGLLQGFYSPSSVKDIKRMMQVDKPDVVIVHNLYPYISPAILKPIKEAGVPIVMTVHNFRLMCPTGLFMQNARPCERCLGGHEWNCIRYNCEHSFLKSLGYAGRNWYARITKAYIDHVDVYVCITRFQIQKLTQAGFDPHKMVHIPNFQDDVKREPNYKPGDYVAISGRLSEEKGIDLALEVAAQTPEIRYVFAGSPRKGYEITRSIPGNCAFLGYISKTELAGFYQNSRFLLNMSRCYEGFPMTILEAASYGKPAIAPAHAGFLEIIDQDVNGLHFIPGDAADLKEKIQILWNNPARTSEMGHNAFLKLRNHYTSEAVKLQWETLLEKLRVKN